MRIAAALAKIDPQMARSLRKGAEPEPPRAVVKHRRTIEVSQEFTLTNRSDAPLPYFVSSSSGEVNFTREYFDKTSRTWRAPLKRVCGLGVVSEKRPEKKELAPGASMTIRVPAYREDGRRYRFVFHLISEKEWIYVASPHFGAP